MSKEKQLINDLLLVLAKEEVDLFEYPEAWPEDLKAMIEKWNQVACDGFTYTDCEEFDRDLKTIGFTIDYDLSAEPFDLHKIEVVENA